MAIFGPRRVKNRKFDYTPVYYNPEKERREKGRKPIRFHHSAKSRRHSSLIWIGVLIFLILYSMTNMGTLFEKLSSFLFLK